MNAIQTASVSTRRWWSRNIIRIGVPLLAIYISAIWLDLPFPAGDGHAQGLPTGATSNQGVAPVLPARPAEHWWNKIQGLRGFDVFPKGWNWPKLTPGFGTHWLAVFALGLWGAAGLWWMERRTAQFSKRTLTLAITFLVVFSFLFQLGTLSLKSDNPEQLLIMRVSDPDFTGYFGSALEINDVSSFFDQYDSTLASPTFCYHCRTHPPGPVLFYWLLLRAVETWPVAWQQNIAQVLMALGHLEYPPLRPSGKIVLVIGSNLILLAAATIVIPLYGLARRLSGPHRSIPLAALGTVLPGLILMSPEFDQLYGTLAAWLFYMALRGLSNRRHSGLWGIGAGLLMAFSTYWSFGLWVLLIPLILMALASMLGLLHSRVDSNEETWHQMTPRTTVAWLTGMALGILLPWGLLSGVGRFPLLEVLRRTGGEHLSGITAFRPYVPWLIFNLVDFFQFVGLPLVVALILTLVWQPVGATHFKTRFSRGDKSLPKRIQDWILHLFSRLNTYAVLFVITVAALDISGTTRAEVGRIWIFLMPLALLAIYNATGRGKLELQHIHGLLASQFLICVVIGGNWQTP